MSVLPVFVNFSDDIFGMDPFEKFLIAPRDLWLTHQKRKFPQQKLCGRQRCKLDCKNSCAKNSKTAENGGFEMSLDVKNFKPEEISVKAVDNHIVVEAKHEEREDDKSFISRHFIRRYTVPEDCNIQEVMSTLSSDGVLTVKAPPVAKARENKERVIEIQQIAPPNSQENANQ